MGCVESRRRKKAVERSKRISEEIKREEKRKRREVKVLVIEMNGVNIPKHVKFAVTEVKSQKQLLYDGEVTIKVYGPRCIDAQREQTELEGTATGLCAVDTHTKNIIETRLTANDRDYRILDLAGDISTLKMKWIHCIEDVNVIIFLVDISQYDIKSEENPKENAMIESMNLFGEVCQTNWFRETPIFLVLNNMELFGEKLLQTPLCSSFSDYRGLDTPEQATAYVFHRYEALDPQKGYRIVHRRCFGKSDNRTILNEISDMCPINEFNGDENTGTRQSGICDEPLIDILCLIPLYYCIYYCCVQRRHY